MIVNETAKFVKPDMCRRSSWAEPSSWSRCWSSLITGGTVVSSADTGDLPGVWGCWRGRTPCPRVDKLTHRVQIMSRSIIFAYLIFYVHEILPTPPCQRGRGT